MINKEDVIKIINEEIDEYCEQCSTSEELK